MLLGAAGRIPGSWREITAEGLAQAAGEGFASPERSGAGPGGHGRGATPTG